MESIKYKIAVNEMYDIIVDRLTKELISIRDDALYIDFDPCEVAHVIKREDKQIKQLAADYVEQNLNDEDVNKISFVDHERDIITFPFKRGNYICPLFPANDVSFYEHAYIMFNIMKERLLLDLSLNFPNENEDKFKKFLDKYYRQIRETAESFADDWSEDLSYRCIRKHYCRIENGILHLNGEEYKVVLE